MAESAEWVPIVYRDFFDFPRAFFVRTAVGWLFFDGHFDDALDEYPEEFAVYEMGDAGPESFVGTWSEVPKRARGPRGSVALNGDSFDRTRRAAVRLAVLRQFTGDA